MLVLSSPSGAGKSTIANEILQRDGNLTMSVSVTTRPPRPGEAPGEDYIFVDAEQFARMVADGAFLEHAEVFGNLYGTPRERVETALAAGRDTLFDVDWQGTRQISENSGDELVGVFILPPSLEELERRLRTRAQDSDDVVRQRMARAADEMRHYDEYRYVIINQDLEKSVRDVEVILAAERQAREGGAGGETASEADALRRENQAGLPDFVASLLGS